MAKKISQSIPQAQKNNLAATSKRIGFTGTAAGHVVLFALLFFAASSVAEPLPVAPSDAPIAIALTTVTPQKQEPQPVQPPVQEPPPPEPVPEKSPEPVKEPPKKEKGLTPEKKKKPPKKQPPTGQKPVAPQPTPPKESQVQAQQNKQAQQTVASLLVAQIEKHKRYPNAARRLGLSGVVTITVKLDGAGALGFIQCKGGHPMLEKAASEAMHRVQKDWKPQPLAKGMTIQVPLRFALK